MTWTYDPTSAADKDLVRLLITDTDNSNPLFEDEEINNFLTVEASNVKLAAANALLTIASNQALILKVGRVADVQTDGAKLAMQISAHAAELRRQVYESGDFDIAELVYDDFTWRERLLKQALRLNP